MSVYGSSCIRKYQLCFLLDLAVRAVFHSHSLWLLTGADFASCPSHELPRRSEPVIHPVAVSMEIGEFVSDASTFLLVSFLLPLNLNNFFPCKHLIFIFSLQIRNSLRLRSLSRTSAEADLTSHNARVGHPASPQVGSDCL